MDKNTIIGFVLIAAIFVAMGILNKPSKEELARQQQERDSLALVEKQNELERKYEEAKRLEANESQQRKNDSLELEIKKLELGDFSVAAEGTQEIYTIENELIKLKVSSLGGRPYSVELKNYKTYDQKPLILFDGDSTEFALQFKKNQRPVQTDELYFTLAGENKNVVVVDEGKELAVQVSISEDKFIKYIYKLAPNSYQVDMDIELSGLQDISGSYDSRSIDFKWGIYARRQEKGWKNEAQYSNLHYKVDQEDMESMNMRSTKAQSEEVLAKMEWIAFKDQFFSSVIMAPNMFNEGKVEIETLQEDSDHIKRYHAQLKIPFYQQEKEVIPLSFYFGPNDFKLLKSEYSEEGIYEIVSVGGGIIRWINRVVIINIFNWLNGSIANYGIIILLLTLIIKMALMPFTFKSYISQAKMRVLKPMIDEATEKIPQDKAMERQQATMAIYKKAGVSPMGGCLPMLLQMPILFAMFRFFPSSIELRQESFLWATDLSTYDSIFEWTAQIPFISKHYGNHISLFTILMTVTTVLSMKMSGSAQTSNQMPGMKGMMYMMPVMMMIFLNKFSAGLTYYYFLANVITLGQNLLFKQFIDEEALLAKMKARKAKPAKKSKFQQRLEEAAKQRGVQTPKKR